MKKLLFIFVFVLQINIVFNSNACTTFLVSGKYTSDGRPLLYKHRDTGESNNALMKFEDGKYKYIGLVNATTDWSRKVWGGYNETGFAIINSAAYNNNIGDKTKVADQEGVVMKLALQKCATLDDFETMLDTLPKPLGVDANFAVIDAQGGAAYYETGNFKYVKADANDPLLAPHGFLVRTNHSFTGDIAKGFGYIRYQTAYSVLYNAAATRTWEPQYLLNHISRNFTHSLIGEDMSEKLPESAESPDFRFFVDYIPRYTSVSTILIVGAKNTEEANGTMMWAIPGFPLTTLAVPVWLDAKVNLPKVVSIDKSGHAPMCDAALQLKKKCFPVERGSGKKYINLSVVMNAQNNGYLQLIMPAEDIIFGKASLLDNPNGRANSKDIQEFYNWLDGYVAAFYSKMFGINIL